MVVCSLAIALRITIFGSWSPSRMNSMQKISVCYLLSINTVFSKLIEFNT